MGNGGWKSGYGLREPRNEELGGVGWGGVGLASSQGNCSRVYSCVKALLVTPPLPSGQDRVPLQPTAPNQLSLHHS